MLELLDIVFDIIHLSVILVNIFFWCIPGFCRRLFLITFSMTWISWLLLGMFYGLGYCFLTDIHWSIKSQLGMADLPSSYITYALDRFLGLRPGDLFVYRFSALVFAALFLIYSFFLYCEIKRRLSPSTKKYHL